MPPVSIGMRVGAIVLAAVMATVAWPARAAGTASPRAHCFPRGADGLVRSTHTRVYRLKDKRDTSTFACNLRTGRRRLLGSTELGSYVFPPPAIAPRGDLVGYAVEDQSDPVSPFLTTINVINVRTGRFAIQPPLADPPNQNAQVGRLALKPSGAVAWTACGPNAPSEGDPRPDCVRPGAEVRVYRFIAGGDQPELLDHGTTIDPRSLRLAGGAFRWTSGGMTRSEPPVR